ncbi:MAG: flavin reductase family protein [Bacteroidota bacterium]
MSRSTEADNLIRIMRRLPYPVTVVTTRAGDRVRGITIGSFTSLSLDPPLVSFNVTCDSQIHELFEQASRFVVHFPGAGQESLCTRFALPDQSDNEQFDSIELDEAGPEDPPLLAGVDSRLHCRLEELKPAGDHSIVIGRVIHSEFLREGPAMLYMGGEYRSLSQ